MSLQPAPTDEGKPCGVDYQLITYVVEDGNDEKIYKKYDVKNNIRFTANLGEGLVWRSGAESPAAGGKRGSRAETPEAGVFYCFFFFFKKIT